MNIGIKVHVCGARDLEGMNSYKWAPYKMIKYIVEAVPSYAAPYKGDTQFAGYAYYNIAAVGHKRHGEESLKCLNRVNRFKSYVEKRKLGTVTIAPDSYNPHYGRTHVLRPAIFTPDTDAIIKFAEKKGWLPMKSQDENWGNHPSWALSVIEMEHRRGD